jgi:hypothetical protein
MDVALKKVLVKLMVAPRSETESMFRKLDGDWWNSQRRVPDKFLVLKRNYDMSDDRLPTPVPFEDDALAVNSAADGGRLFARRTWSVANSSGAGHADAAGAGDLLYPRAVPGLADRAERADQTQLERIEK